MIINEAAQQPEKVVGSEEEQGICRLSFHLALCSMHSFVKERLYVAVWNFGSSIKVDVVTLRDT